MNNLPFAPVIPSRAARTPGTSAAECFESLVIEIESFQQTVDCEHDVCMMLTNFGQSILMEVTEVGYQSSGTICFSGYVNGNLARLVQHYTQLNFLLLATPKPEPEKQPNRIGFIIDD